MISIKNYVKIRKAEITAEIDKLEIKPKLVIVQVGDVEASNRYVKNKLKDCEEVSLPCELIHLSEDIDEAVLINTVVELNANPEVSGFIIQLPLPKHIDENKIIELIDPDKDVDGFSKKAKVMPATPTGFIDYLDYNNFNFKDANAVVIGRSSIVGRPAAKMLLDRDCNVTVIHSKTSERNKARALTEADLVIVATGHRNTLMDLDILPTKPSCFIIDVGINFNEAGKLCGDCEAVTLREKTPCPGGCGLTTRLALITNLLKLVK